MNDEKTVITVSQAVPALNETGALVQCGKDNNYVILTKEIEQVSHDTGMPVCELINLLIIKLGIDFEVLDGSLDI